MVMEDPDGHGVANSHNNSEPPDRRTFGQQALDAIRLFGWILHLAALGRIGMVLWSMGIPLA